MNFNYTGTNQNLGNHSLQNKLSIKPLQNKLKFATNSSPPKFTKKNLTNCKKKKLLLKAVDIHLQDFQSNIHYKNKEWRKDYEKKRCLYISYFLIAGLIANCFVELSRQYLMQKIRFGSNILFSWKNVWAIECAVNIFSIWLNMTVLTLKVSFKARIYVAFTLQLTTLLFFITKFVLLSYDFQYYDILFNIFSACIIHSMSTYAYYCLFTTLNSMVSNQSVWSYIGFLNGKFISMGTDYMIKEFYNYSEQKNINIVAFSFIALGWMLMGLILGIIQKFFLKKNDEFYKLYSEFKIADIRFENLLLIIKKFDYSMIQMLISTGISSGLIGEYISKQIIIDLHNHSRPTIRIYSIILIIFVMHGLGTIAPIFMKLKGKKRKIFSAVAFISNLIIWTIIIIYKEKLYHSESQLIEILFLLLLCIQAFFSYTFAYWVFFYIFHGKRIIMDEKEIAINLVMQFIAVFSRIGQLTYLYKVLN